MHKKIKWIIIISFSLVCLYLCALAGYKLYFWVDYSDRPETLHGSGDSYPSKGGYEINPETILSSLDRGETGVFVPIIATPEVYTPLSTGSFSWRQSDYLKIAEALAQFKWQENLSDWYVYMMTFYKECNDNPEGFDNGEIIYFKNYTENGTSYYDVYAVVVYPLFKQVVWGRSTFPKPLLGWKSIDLDRLKVTADDALQIAEDEGGREDRLKENNLCRIFIINNANQEGDNDWRISYSNFEIHIDPYSGRYKIIDPGK